LGLVWKKQTQRRVDGVENNKVTWPVPTEVNLGQEVSLAPAYQEAALV